MVLRVRLSFNPFRKFESFISEGGEFRILRRIEWDLKKAYPELKRVTANIEKLISYILQSRQLKQELAKSKELTLAQIKARQAQYDERIKEYIPKLKSNIKDFLDIIKYLFDNIKQMDFACQGMSDKQLKRIRDFRKVTQKKLRELIKKENKISEKELTRIIALEKEVVAGLKSRWQKAKRQRTGYWEPGTELVNIATDQLPREMKNEGKAVVGLVKEENNTLSKLKRAPTSAELTKHFNNLITLYSQTNIKIGYTLEFVKVMIHRYRVLKDEVKTLSANVKLRGIDGEFNGLNAHIAKSLGDIEDQSRLLMNKGASKLERTKIRVPKAPKPSKPPVAVKPNQIKAELAKRKTKEKRKIA